VDNSALGLSDSHVRSVLSRISSTNVSETRWLQGSLPVWWSVPAFRASSASTSDLQSVTVPVDYVLQHWYLLRSTADSLAGGIRTHVFFWHFDSWQAVS